MTSRHLRRVLLAFACSAVAVTGAALVHAQVGVRPADQWIATLDNPQRIAGMIAERGLQSSVELIANPTNDAVHALLAGALAMVMPSRFEGFGMVAAEAMAAGVPVVAAGVDAVPDVVGADGGVLVPREDAAATAHAIAALLDAPDRRAALSASARIRARRWSWDEVARDHLAWLQRISEGRHTSPSPSGSR